MRGCCQVKAGLGAVGKQSGWHAEEERRGPRMPTICGVHRYDEG